MAVTYNPAGGWRSAPDCARCADTGRFAELGCRATQPVSDCPGCVEAAKPPHQHRLMAMEHTGHLEHHLSTVSAHCACKRGRKASELWYAEKHGLPHLDEPEPEPPDDYYDEVPF